MWDTLDAPVRFESCGGGHRANERQLLGCGFSIPILPFPPRPLRGVRKQSTCKTPVDQL